MLRTRSGLSRPVLKWVSQVAASLGATLAATVIWSAVPHPAPEARPELTSGGKFAARAVEAVAYDGLDAMPLPRIAAAPADVQPVPALIRAAWEGAPASVLPSERPARPARPARAPVRAEARRAPSTEPQPRPALPAEAAEPAPAAEASQPERGMFASVVPAVTATARTAWRFTASAGDALVARVASQVP